MRHAVNPTRIREGQTAGTLTGAGEIKVYH